MVNVGMALYSVRKEMSIDPLKTIQNVGELGYKFIEAANYDFDTDFFLGFGITPKEFKSIMDRYGMKLINCHIGRADLFVPGSDYIYHEMPRIFDLEDDDIRRCAEAHLEAGNNCLTIPIVFYPNSIDAIMKRVEYLRHLTELAAQSGVNLVYHPHWQEYVKIDGKFVLDYVMENTDMKLEIDTYWAMRSGENPVDMIQRYKDKIIFVHQKDFPKNTTVPVNIWHWLGMDMKYGKIVDRYTRNREFFMVDQPDCFAEIGTGIMPIQEIVDAVNEYTKAKYIILEQDFSSLGDNMLSAKVSMENFRKMNGINFL